MKLIHQIILSRTTVFLIAVCGFLSRINGMPVILSGTVVDGESRQSLPNANIFVKSLNTGTISDGDGKFSLNIPSDSFPIELVVHYIGYEPYVKQISNKETVSERLVILLKVKPVSFRPIEIIGESSLEKQKRIEPSMYLLDIKRIPAIPTVGEGDVFRLMQTIPGVNSTSELSNQLYIRGGSPDQNLILINGIPIYQPYHLFGLSSSVDDASIDYVRYYTGGFSVRHGDRMSSVVDMMTKPGTDSLTAYLDWNLMNYGGTISGPIGSHVRWRITGRRTYFDKLAEFSGDDFPYAYYDWEGKLSYFRLSQHLMNRSG